MPHAGPPQRHAQFARPDDVRLGDVLVEEYAYGVGPPTGMLLMRYRATTGGGCVALPAARDDFTHQLYWAPDAAMVVDRGRRSGFVGPREAFWAQRGVVHGVVVPDGGSLLRVRLREVPPALGREPASVVAMPVDLGEALRAVARPGVTEQEGLAVRRRLMDTVGAGGTQPLDRPATEVGPAQVVARELTHDPSSPLTLEDWAIRLHTSVKTLQRDFDREFGVPWSTWRTRLRLRAAEAMLPHRSVTDTAHHVGYTSVSAFVSAFTREYGRTPGAARHDGRDLRPDPHV